MSPLAKYLFAFILNHTTPGNSVYSMELLPVCGTDKEHATCEVKPVCDTASPLCAAPRWSSFRNGWVRVETREKAAERAYNASISLVRAATYLTRCKDIGGNVIEDGCKVVFWPEGPQGLACGDLASSVWESGYREDIMVGAPPAGRGPDGEACVMQVMPEYVSTYADWPIAKPVKDMTTEDWAAEVLGSDQEHLERCYRVGGRMLSRMRAAARYKCQNVSWIYGMYAMYGTGGQCAPKQQRMAQKETQDTGLVLLYGKENAPVRANDWAQQRAATYLSCMKGWPDREKLPDWAEVWLQSYLSQNTATDDDRLAYANE